MTALGSAVAVGAPPSARTRRVTSAWVRRRLPLVSYLATHVAIAVGVLLVVFRDQVLPAKFFYDGDHIQQLGLGRSFSYGDTSYANVAAVYRVLGLADQPVVAALLGYVLFVVALVLAMRGMDRAAFPTMLIVPLVTVIGSIYLGFYSKDVLVLPVVLLVLIAGRTLVADAAIVGLIAVYASLFRSYWFIVALFFLALRVVLTRVRSLTLLFLLAALAVVATAFAMSVVLGAGPDQIRDGINASREGASDATTIIRPFVSLPDPAGGLINVLLTFISLMIPLPLAALGGAYYLALATLIALLWIAVFRMLPMAARFDWYPADPRFVRSFALLAAFVMTQALFEPDYGSALRHLSPLLPLLVFVACRRTAMPITSALPWRGLPRFPATGIA